MLRFSPVFGLSRSVAHVSFHFLHVIFPRGGFRFGEFIRCMPKSRTVRQPPADFEPCAGCRQPAHGFLPARFHTCLSAHRFCPHFSACTLLSVLSCLYFYNYIFLFVFSYLRFSACTFPLALYARSFPLVLFRPRFPVCTFLIALFCLAFSFPLFPSRSFPPALSCMRFPVHTVSFSNRSILTFPTVSVFHTHRNALRLLPAFFQTVPSSFQAHFPLRFSRFQKKTRRPVS